MSNLVPKFNIGNRVKILKRSVSSKKNIVGKEGVVDTIFQAEDGGVGYEVAVLLEFTDLGKSEVPLYGCYDFHESDNSLELIAEP